MSESTQSELPESIETLPVRRRGLSRAVALMLGAAAAVGTAGLASAEITIPATMEPDALVTGGLAALGPIFVPAVTLVATVGLALGIVRFIWSSARKGGRGG